MVRDVAGALRTRRKVLSIALDSDMDREVKLFAFCLQAYLIGRDEPGWEPRHWAHVIGEMMERPGSVGLRGFGPVRACQRVIAKDVPRYEIPYAGEVLVCRSPKARGPQAGEPCGKPAGRNRQIDRDPLTGEGEWVGYCRNHSHPSLDEWRVKRLRAWDFNGRPNPPVNTGGVLMRYFKADWDSVYSWAQGWVNDVLVEAEDVAINAPSFVLIEGAGEDTENSRSEAAVTLVKLECPR